MSNPFNIDALYRTGYSSVYDPTKDKSDRRNAINNVLGFALKETGKWAIQRYKQNFEDLKELKAQGRASKTAIQMEMNKVGGVLSPQLQVALTQFKKEYDKGAEMSVRGWGRKKKEKGQAMMDMAFQKMTTLSSQVKLVNEQMQTQIDNGFKELGVKADGVERNGYSPGATEPQLTNSVQLATGKMLQNLEVDLNTGEMNYLKQKEFNASDAAYNEYVESVGGASEGVLSQDEWAQTNQANMGIEKVLFNRVDFAEEADNSIFETIDPMYEDAERLGAKGGEINEYDDDRLNRKLNPLFKNASDNALRTYMFGSEINVMVGGKLQRVSPAIAALLSKGYKPGDAGAEEGSVERNHYEEFQGALSEMRSSDFSKGSPFRAELQKLTKQSIKDYQINAKNEYDAKQKNSGNKNTKIEKLNLGYGHYYKADLDPKVESIINGKTFVDLQQREWTWDNGAKSFYLDTDPPTYRNKQQLFNLIAGNASRHYPGFEEAIAPKKSNKKVENNNESNDDNSVNFNVETDIPKDMQVNINGEIKDVTTLNNEDVNALNMTDKMKWLRHASKSWSK